MKEIEKWVTHLSSTNEAVRFEACEMLRVSPRLTEGAVLALQLATKDHDPLVADAARRALAVHRGSPIEASVASLAPSTGLAAPPEQHSQAHKPETKKCPYCAETIKYEAIVCRYCGRDLRQPVEALPTAAAHTTKHPKKPWLAVALNLFPLVMGLGYLYLGRPLRFVAVFAIQLFSLAPMAMLGLREYNQYVLAALWIFSLFDAYAVAGKVNSTALAGQSPRPPYAA